MAHKTFDLAQQLTTSTGNGALILGAVPAGLLGFADAGATDGDTFWGCIRHITANEVEVTLCTWHNDGTITRASVPLISTTGSKIAFSAGTKTISCVAPASKSAVADANGQIVFPGVIVSKGQRESVAAAAIAVGVLTLDLAAATNFTVALTANITSLVLSGMTAGYAASFSVLVTADGTARTWTMPGSVTPLDGTYVPSSGNGKRDLLCFVTFDGGTTWLLSIARQDF